MPITRQECPICFEVMDDTDLALLPCQCDYQVCLWCLQRIRQQENNKCPQCRREYDESTYRRVPIATILSRRVTEEGESIASSQQAETKTPLRSNGTNNESRRSSLCGVKGEDSESQTNDGPRFGKHPTICRLYNCPNYLLNAQVLAQFRYLGKYGRLLSIVICNVKNPDRSTAFATYAREEDAILAQQDIAKFVSRSGDSIMRTVRFQIGAARHCIQALRGMTCTNDGCPFIHGHVDKGPKYFWKANKKGPSWMRSVLTEKICQEIIQDPLKESLFTLTLPDIQKLNYGIFIPNLAIDTEKREWCQVTMCDRSISGWQEGPVTGDSSEGDAADESSAKGLARRTWQRVSMANERHKDHDDDPAFPALCREQPVNRTKDVASFKEKMPPTEQMASLEEEHPQSNEESSRGAQTPSTLSEQQSTLPVRLSFIPPPPSSPSYIQMDDVSGCEASEVKRAESNDDNLSGTNGQVKPVAPSEASPVTPTTVSPQVIPPQQQSVSPHLQSQTSSPPQAGPHASSRPGAVLSATSLAPPSVEKAASLIASPPAATERVGMKVFLPPPGLVRPTTGDTSKSSSKEKPDSGETDKSNALSSLYGSTSSDPRRLPSSENHLMPGMLSKKSLLLANVDRRDNSGRGSYTSTTTAVSKCVDVQSTAAFTRRDPIIAYNEDKAYSEVPSAAVTLPRSFTNGQDYQSSSDYFRWDESSAQQSWLMDDKSMDIFDCLYTETSTQSKPSIYDASDPPIKQREAHDDTYTQAQPSSEEHASDKYISEWLTNLLGQLSNTQSTPAPTLGPCAQQTESLRNKMHLTLAPSDDATIGTHSLKSGWSGMQASPQQPTGRTSNTKLYNYYTSSNPQPPSNTYSNVSEHKLAVPMDDYRPAGPIQHLSSSRSSEPSLPAMPPYRVPAAGVSQWGGRAAHQYSSHLTTPNHDEPELATLRPYDTRLADMSCDAAPSGHYHGANSNTSDSASVAFLRSVVPNATINISSSANLGGNSYNGGTSSTADQARSGIHRNRLNIGQPAYYRQDYN